jgi:hypothetical protein
MALKTATDRQKRIPDNDRDTMKAKAERVLMADVSKSDIDILMNMGAAITADTDPADVRDRVKMQSNVLNPTIKDQEIKDVLSGTITEPTGKFKKDQIKKD